VAKQVWDTWTRNELLTARGYQPGPENSPASSGLQMGHLAVRDEVGLDASNGSEISQSRPRGLEAPEELPVADRTKASVTALEVPVGRPCSECGGALPPQSRPERATCSPPCAQRRHDRLRKSREALKVKALQVRTKAVAPVELSGPIPVMERQKRQEDSVLEAVVHLRTLLPAGWRAEVEPGNVVLSWRAG
jgi:hypothetical protein